MRARRIYSNLGQGSAARAPGPGCRVVLTGGQQEYIGKTGQVLRLRGLGLIQVKIDESGEVLNVNFHHLKELDTGE